MSHAEELRRKKLVPLPLPDWCLKRASASSVS